MNRAILLACLLIVGCDTREQSSTQSDASANGMAGSGNAVETAAELPAAAWAGKPFNEWPPLLLTNEAQFRGHSSLEGASAFLIRNDSGVMVAATARHLVGAAGGVEPPVSLARFDQELSQWMVFPRTQKNKRLAIGGLAIGGLEREGLDWLVLKVKERDAAKLPSVPLAMRKEPVKVGEAVFLVGVPYSESDRIQNVYRGTVTERARGDRFRYSISPAADIRGFSGAPILDAKGYAVGVMTVWFSPKRQGEAFLEAGGEDIAAIRAEVDAIRP